MNKFRGAYVAIVTPFTKDGKVDEKGLKDLIEFQIKNGTHGIVPCGTTGESATLTHEEHHRVVALTIKTVKGRVPVLAGTGSNSTSESIELTRAAKAAGADGALMITPYYNKPTQEGLFLHFKSIAEAVDLPLVLYNVPGRSVADLAHDTVLRLAQVKGIVGIKEATGNIERAQWLIREVPKGFAVYSGDDPTAVALMLCGGQGNVSVTANVAPRLMHELCMAAIAGDIKRAMEIQFSLMPVHKQLFVEANPIPVKWAMARMKLCGPTLRLPMTPLEPSNEATVENALRVCGLI